MWHGTGEPPESAYPYWGRLATMCYLNMDHNGVHVKCTYQNPKDGKVCNKSEDCGKTAEQMDKPKTT